MELMLFLKDLRLKGALYYQTWMPLLIQYNGESQQAIKLSVTPNVPKSTYYRVISYGIEVFPKYVKSTTIIKKRNELIIEKVTVNVSSVDIKKSQLKKLQDNPKLNHHTKKI